MEDEAGCVRCESRAGRCGELRDLSLALDLLSTATHERLLIGVFDPLADLASSSAGLVDGGALGSRCEPVCLWVRSILAL